MKYDSEHDSYFIQTTTIYTLNGGHISQRRAESETALIDRLCFIWFYRARQTTLTTPFQTPSI